MPSCRGIHFLDQEQLIILEDGLSNVFICSIEMQKRSFQEKVNQKQNREDAVRTIKIEDETSLLSTDFARKEGKRSIISKSDDNNEEPNYDELKDTAGVKVIRFDEDIRSIFCAQNTSPFGYIAVLG